MIMKKFFNTLFVIIAAMVTFAACIKEENAPASEIKTVQFLAESIETKTAFGAPEDGTYPTLWSTNDAVKILVNLEQIANTEKKVYVLCSDDFKSARFTAELATPEAENFTFYSISPADAFKGKSSDKGYIYVTIPTEQTPLTTSVDMAAQLLYASSETTETMPTSVELTYHHLTAYGKLSLTNLTPNVSSVSEIKLEAPENVYIAGNWDYFVADGSFAVRSGKGSNSIVLSTTNTNDIWFACAPVDMSGKKMTLTVTTDKGDLKKEITFPENRKFKAGRISKFTVDMAGVEVDTPEDPEVASAYYEKVTSDLADWSGTYLMVCTSESMALSGISTTSTKYGIGSEVTIEDNKIAATDELASSQIVISPSLTTEDAYLMAFNGGYLSWTSGNSLKVSDEDNINSNWKITVSDANVSISNCKDDTRKIVWNASSPRFACYTTAQTAIQLYKLVENEGGESPEPKPRTLVSITVENPKTEYTVFDTFVEPTVKATYDDATTATVTGAIFTGNDLTSEGTKTVTVSYTEGEVTVTTTFNITVSAQTDYSGTYAIVAYRNTNTEQKYYYLTNEETQTSTVRLTAVFAGKDKPNDNVELAASKLWNVSKSGSVYTIQSVASDEYVSWTSGNSANMSETGVEFAITRNDDETYCFGFADGSDTRYLSLNTNAGSNYFAMYTGTQTQNLYLIKAVEGEEAPATLESITVNGQKTQFIVGDSFEFGGTVTATYSDESTADVTSDATFTGYDMSNAGSYEVTVTYGGKTCTYDITVAVSGGDLAPKFVKVTSAPSDWSGTYLIVCESGSVAFDGSLNTLDAVSNTKKVTISDNEIEATDEMKAITFEIAKNGSGYTVKSKSGYYVGQSSDANGLKSNKSTPYNHTISLSGNDVNMISGGAYLRYNATSGQTRFRYYKSSSYTNQKAIQLYKLED